MEGKQKGIENNDLKRRNGNGRNGDKQREQEEKSGQITKKKPLSSEDKTAAAVAVAAKPS